MQASGLGRRHCRPSPNSQEVRAIIRVQCPSGLFSGFLGSFCRVDPAAVIVFRASGLGREFFRGIQRCTMADDSTLTTTNRLMRRLSINRPGGLRRALSRRQGDLMSSHRTTDQSVVTPRAGQHLQPRRDHMPDSTLTTTELELQPPTTPLPPPSAQPPRPPPRICLRPCCGACCGGCVGQRCGECCL